MTRAIPLLLIRRAKKVFPLQICSFVFLFVIPGFTPWLFLVGRDGVRILQKATCGFRLISTL